MFTNNLLMGVILFVTLPMFFFVVTSYCIFQYKCFANHYQSKPVLYVTTLPMINIIIIHNIVNPPPPKPPLPFPPATGTQYLTNHTLTVGITKFRKICKYFTSLLPLIDEFIRLITVTPHHGSHRKWYTNPKVL